MYHGRHEKIDHSVIAGNGQKNRNRRLTALLLSAVLLLTLTVGGTIAYLTAQSETVTNTFLPSSVTCAVTENFDGQVKQNVNVTNTGDIAAYIRVKLVTYRVNAQGQHIGGTADLPQFTLGTDWVKYGDYYYYTLPVEPGKQPASNLADQITLTGSYGDVDGGSQAIDVMAEAIQSVPAKAVGEAWGVSIAQGSVTAYTGN